MAEIFADCIGILIGSITLLATLETLGVISIGITTIAGTLTFAVITAIVAAIIIIGYLITAWLQANDAAKEYRMAKNLLAQNIGKIATILVLAKETLMNFLSRKKNDVSFHHNMSSLAKKFYMHGNGLIKPFSNSVKNFFDDYHAYILKATTDAKYALDAINESINRILTPQWTNECTLIGYKSMSLKNPQTEQMLDALVVENHGGTWGFSKREIYKNGEIHDDISFVNIQNENEIFGNEGWWNKHPVPIFNTNNENISIDSLVYNETVNGTEAVNSEHFDSPYHVDLDLKKMGYETSVENFEKNAEVLGEEFYKFKVYVDWEKLPDWWAIIDPKWSNIPSNISKWCERINDSLYLVQKNLQAFNNTMHQMGSLSLKDYIDFPRVFTLEPEHKHSTTFRGYVTGFNISNSSGNNTISTTAMVEKEKEESITPFICIDDEPHATYSEYKTRKKCKLNEIGLFNDTLPTWNNLHYRAVVKYKSTVIQGLDVASNFLDLSQIKNISMANDEVQFNIQIYNISKTQLNDCVALWVVCEDRISNELYLRDFIDLLPENIDKGQLSYLKNISGKTDIKIVAVSTDVKNSLVYDDKNGTATSTWNYRFSKQGNYTIVFLIFDKKSYDYLIRKRIFYISKSAILGEALDNTLLNWSTGGNVRNADWSVAYNVAGHSDVAVSGSIGRGKLSKPAKSWLKTTVTGSGKISFDWKVSGEERFLEPSPFGGGKDVDWTVHP